MSGGIDSAVTAALFKNAGWRVIGVTLPIHQNPEETRRGENACDSLDIEHLNIDLTQEFNRFAGKMLEVDPDLYKKDDKAARIRLGNMRARLRMMTLYNLAALHGGIVGSTDNFSEYAAGFWTLHGDVGDVAPLQSLFKSWDVPALADHLDVPYDVIQAVPTDGLGIDEGDEAQLGFSYLEFDIILKHLLSKAYGVERLVPFGIMQSDKYKVIRQRIKSTAFKRANPVNLNHPMHGESLFNELRGWDKLNLKGK
jgi:nicotinamide-nucleotide amidase